jgi:hypothetical protein
VLEVLAAEETYVSAMHALAARNWAYDKLHANSVLEQFNPETGQCRLLAKDPRDVMLLKHATDNLYRTADAARDRLSLQIEEIEKAGKSLFPRRTFLKVAGHKQQRSLSEQSKQNALPPETQPVSVAK